MPSPKRITTSDTLEGLPQNFYIYITARKLQWFSYFLFNFLTTFGLSQWVMCLSNNSKASVSLIFTVSPKDLSLPVIRTMYERLLNREWLSWRLVTACFLSTLNRNEAAISRSLPSLRSLPTEDKRFPITALNHLYQYPKCRENTRYHRSCPSFPFRLLLSIDWWFISSGTSLEPFLTTGPKERSGQSNEVKELPWHYHRDRFGP